MTENEAIEKHIQENNNRIENIKFFMSSNHDANIDDCKRNIEILIVSNKALEKQIPKKVIDTEKFNSPYWQCSKCGCELYSGQIFCDDCGQKLSWESD